MKCFLAAVAVAAQLCVLASAVQQPLSREEEISRVRQRREMTLEESEVEYHGHLHLEQERKVAAMRRPSKELNSTGTNQDDQDAIVAFYHSTNGPKWVNSTGWLKGDPCTDPYWYGLYCLNGRVLQINLVYNGVSGPIPGDLAKASALQVLRLYDNMLTGGLPAELFQLQSLQVIDVSTNEMTGMLPSRIDMANLTDLVLYGNTFKGEFPSTFNAPNLQLLEVSSNSFTGNLPEGLSRATGLTQLVVSRNAFTGSLPSSYGSLVKLERLWTFYNMFSSPMIPDSYKAMVNLLQVQADNLSGPLPDWLGSWTKMQYLILINGKLSGGFPESLCSSRDMVSLRLFNNSLTGALPSCVCDMSKMTDLELSDNQFSGDIPDMFQNCRSLQAVYLSRNTLSGEFPASLGTPVNLTVIDVSSNGLYGTIPNSINNLKKTIAEFAIAFNMFSDIESGVDDFFKRIVDYTCLFYNNPWSCPLSTQVPKECSADCNACNAQDHHKSCSACVPNSGCGWCDKGQNCLKGDPDGQGPDRFYQCESSDWKVGSC